MGYRQLKTYDIPVCPRHHIPMEIGGTRFYPDKGVKRQVYQCRKTWQTANSFCEAQCRQWAEGPDEPYTPPKNN